MKLSWNELHPTAKSAAVARIAAGVGDPLGLFGSGPPADLGLIWQFRIYMLRSPESVALAPIETLIIPSFMNIFVFGTKQEVLGDLELIASPDGIVPLSMGLGPRAVAFDNAIVKAISFQADEADIPAQAKFVQTVPYQLHFLLLKSAGGNFVIPTFPNPESLGLDNDKVYAEAEFSDVFASAIAKFGSGGRYS